MYMYTYIYILGRTCDNAPNGCMKSAASRL